MNINNLIVLTKVFLGYSVLVFGLSAFFLKPLLAGKGFTKGFLACFLAGNFYVMNVVFILLLFFHCSSRFLTVFFLLLGAALLRIWFDWRKAQQSMQGAWNGFQRLISGTYGWHLFFRRARRGLFGSLRGGMRFVFIEHTADVAGVAFCLLLHGSYTARRLILYSGYGGYDEVVHTAWVQNMMQGEIYSAGVYPFGFHEMIYAVAKVFGMYAQQVLRDFGFITVIYMALMLYCLIAELLKNRLIAFTALFFYSVVCIYHGFSWDRFGFGYPQEFGLVCIYPMVIFLFYYFREKDMFSLFFFGMAFSMTLYIHYYITIVALILCFCIGAVYFFYMLKKKMLVQILICGIVFSLIGASTMVLGVVTGHRLQGSLYWALGVIGMSDEEEDETEDSTDGAGEGEEADEETGTERVVYVAGEDLGLASGGGIVTGSAAHVAGEGLGLVSGGGIVTGSAAHIAGAGLLSGGGIVTGSTDDVSGEGAAVPLLQRVREKLILIGTGMKEAMLINCVTENGFWGFLVLWMVSLLLSVIGLFRRKTRMQGAMCISFLFYIAILCVLMASARIGLPVVIEDYRVRVFMCYALPFTIAVPLHFLWTIAESIFLSGQKEKETWRGSLRRYGMIPISVFMLITLVEQNLIRQPANTIVIQANEVVDVLYQIMDDYDDFSWTLVSDVQEYAMCLNNGRHYEWTDLLTKLSNGTMTIKIPTKYVFFAIEKRPICYGEVITTGEDIPIQGEVSRAHAQEAIDLESVASQDQLYVQYRLQLMSKAYYWAKAYAEMFPEEMKVYYEDDNVIYYCLTQEPYYLNNLKIDYQYNSLSGETQESGQEG